MAERRGRGLKVNYTAGSAFHALGLPDTDDLVVKSELVICIERIIRNRKLTQVEAAALLGMDQPKVSAMLRGKLDRFSIERLIRALRDLGQDVRLSVVPASGRKPRGRLVVSAAA